MREQQRRSAALSAIRHFEARNDLPAAELAEREHPDRIDFIGTAPDGREYGVGYLKDKVA